MFCKHLLLSGIVACSLLSIDAMAEDKAGDPASGKTNVAETDAVKAARHFWAELGKGDAAAMKALYAEEVSLLAGSSC